MQNPALQALAPLLSECREPALWWVDENLSEADLAALKVNPGVEVITNRWDQWCRLQSAGWRAQFSDFDSSHLSEGSLGAVFLRVSKEKAVTHYLINQSLKLLRAGGRLYLSGFKQEGAKTYIDKTRRLLGSADPIKKMGKGCYLAVLERQTKPSQRLDDADYEAFREIDIGGGLTAFSKPGQFGWNKIDKGSQLLISRLPALLRGWSRAPATLLDLGCGYGYLSLQAAIQLPELKITATDNNAAALASCRKNFERLGLQGQVQASDAAAEIEQSCDWLLCNPPFHQGFGVDNRLTDHFLAAAARLLSPGGQACFVVNQFIPLEHKAAPYFKTREVLENNGAFKLVCLEH